MGNVSKSFDASSTLALRIHFFSCFTAGSTLFLLFAGALVTGTASGLAVPDWPLSFGQFFPPMVGGVFFEHGHRLVAGTVAILTTAQAFILQKYESRTWVKKMGWTAMGLVLFQATLGGITVIWRLPIAVSVTHACIAQLFFSLTLVIALVTSWSWKSDRKFLLPTASQRGMGLPYFSLTVSIFFLLQLIAGALMRHSGAGLAIPDFPLSYGSVIPPLFDFKIAIHYIHRVGAFTVVTLAFLLAGQVLKRYSHITPLVINAGALATFVILQLMLGAFVIWMRRPVQLTTIHLVLGALCLGTSILMTVQSFRYLGGESFSVFFKRKSKGIPTPISFAGVASHE